MNHFINVALTVNTQQIINLLSTAATFMLFDSTILRVIIPSLALTYDAAANLGNRRVAVALETGKDTLDSADMQSLLSSSVGAPWMYYTRTENRLAAVAAATTQFLSPPEGIDIKSKRRFRENDSTLWMTVENQMDPADANLQLQGQARTLLRIP